MRTKRTHCAIGRATASYRSSATKTAWRSYTVDGLRVAKAIDHLTDEQALDLAATLPVVIRDTEAVHL